MPFMKQKNKAGKTMDARAEVKKNEAVDVAQMTEEGLFDLAYANYEEKVLENPLKRRDFRRQIWADSEKVREYLNDGTFKRYLEVTGYDLAGDEKGEEPVLNLDDVLPKIAMPMDLVDGGELVHTVHADTGTSVSQAEFESTFEPELLDMTCAEDGELFMDDTEPTQTEESDLRQEAAASIYEAKKEVVDVDAVMTETNDFEEEVDEPAADETVDRTSEDAVDMEGESVVEKCHPETLPVPPADVTESKEPVESAAKVPAEKGGLSYTGIFADPQILIGLRKSMYVAENDTSQDEEILSLDKKEVFEQLARLEGVVKKAPVLADLADRVYGRDVSGFTKDEVMKYGMDLVNVLISYLEKYFCRKQDTDYESIHAYVMDELLELTEDEKSLLEQVKDMPQWVICWQHEDKKDYIILPVIYDFTALCRIAFLFEASYNLLEADKFTDFLQYHGIDDFVLSNGEEEKFDVNFPDILIQNGRVTIM